MALISCPECGQVISDKAVSCPHCGLPLTDRAASCSVSDATAEIIPADKPIKSNRTFIIILLTIIAAFFTVLLLKFIIDTIPITKSNVGIDGMYNSTLGVGVKLGMSKDKVDDLLGEPHLVHDSYEYPNGLYVNYIDGDVSSLQLAFVDDTWKTKGDISLGSTSDDVIDALGQPDSKAHDDEWWYYTSGESALCLNIPYDKVQTVYIFYINK